MKRWIVRIVLLLVLGCVTTVAVAWGCAAWSDARSEMFTYVRALDLVRPPRSGTPVPDWVLGEGWRAHDGWRAVPSAPVSALGVQRVGVFELPARPFEWSGTMVPFATRTEAGWPARGLSGEVWYPDVVCARPGLHPDWDRNVLYVFAFPIEVDALLAGSGDFALSTREQRAIPLRPIWPGFVINTLFYGVIWFGIFFGFGSARRTIRKRRGRCPKCGYQLRGQFDTGCSECGWNRESDA